MAQARHMKVHDKKEEEKKARKLTEQADQKQFLTCKRAFFGTAKLARSWRLNHKLGPLYIIDDINCGRYIRRG